MIRNFVRMPILSTTGLNLKLYAGVSQAAHIVRSKGYLEG